MKTAIIIDDESNSIDLLEYEINQIDKELKVIGKCNDARNAAKMITENNPDIVFLDIEMPWFSGFEVLDQLDEITFKIIFVTAYDQYAIKAFRYFAFDYLLKPVDRKSLQETLNRINNDVEKVDQADLKSILSFIQKKDNFGEKIALPSQDGYEFFNTDEIIRCQADSNYTQVFMINGKMIMVSKTLKLLEERLSESNFLRIHQSHLINLKHIVSYCKTDGGEVKMGDGMEIPISRQKRKLFLDKMNFE